MIKNERQLRVAASKLTELQRAREVVDDKAGWRAYTDLIDDLSADIAQYEDVRDGRSRTFTLVDLDSLGEAIIKARIARGWTHKQLAEQLGVTEQQVQKDEARDYENAGLARLAEILDILGYELAGSLKPKGAALAREVEDGASMSTSVSATVSRSDQAPTAGENAETNVIHLSVPMSVANRERIAHWVRRAREGSSHEN